MKNAAFPQWIIAILVLFLVIGFHDILAINLTGIGLAVLFAAIIILSNIGAKKLMASWLDADVEHSIWHFYRFGLAPDQHFKKPVPLGIILPLFLTAFTLGTLKVMTILTYETKARKRRAAKKFGYYSFTEMTDWHNAAIGAAGIVITLLVSFISYWIAGLEPLARLAAFYAFFNILPVSKLDGSQIFFGSRVLWTILATIALLFATYGLVLV